MPNGTVGHNCVTSRIVSATSARYSAKEKVITVSRIYEFGLFNRSSDEVGPSSSICRIIIKSI